MKRLLVAVIVPLLLAGSLARALSLVPATFQPMTDSQGFVWDMDQSGSIQSGSNCFSGVMSPEVNGGGFSVQQSMMSPDGSEVYLDGAVNSLAFSRRIKIDQKLAYVRYFDSVRNTTAAAQNVRLMLRINFNNVMQPPVSDAGTALGPALSAKENGFVIMRPPGQQGPAAVFLLAGKNAKLRPSVQNQQNYRLSVTYNFKVAPGETVSLAYAVAQRALPSMPDSKAMAKLFASINTSKLLSDIPAKDRKGLANFTPGGFSSAPGAPGVVSMLEKLNVERGPSDVLAIGTDTRLKGTASCAKLEIETAARGKVVVPFENIAAVLGGRRESRVLLRDGQAVSGKLAAEGLKFSLATGTSIALNAATLDRLVMRATPNDILPNPEAWGFLETFDGDRLAVKPDPALRLRATTAWGLREVALDELVFCGPTEENPLGVRMQLKDGSYFLAFLDGDEMKFNTLLFGPQSFPVTGIRQIAVVLPRSAEEGGEVVPERAQVAVAGGQILAGQIDLAELHFLSPAGVIPVAANLIRTLQNTSEDGSAGAPVFTATVWGGGSVSGTLREVVVPVRSSANVFQVPVRDLLSAIVPSPAVPEGLRDKIAALLRDLGHTDWEKREAASRELGELGGIARSALSETVKQTNDAEVRRRGQALLDAMETL